MESQEESSKKDFLLLLNIFIGFGKNLPKIFDYDDEVNND